MYEVGEPLLSNVTVTLTGTDHLGSAISQSTTTDAAGFYEFVGLRPGEYLLTESQPLFWTEGGQVPGDPFGAGSPGPSELAASIPLGSNETGLNFDFYEYLTNGLFGVVWQDLDDDGIREAGEPGISGVTVTLTDTGSLVRTFVTGVGGFYFFLDLAPATYTLTETQPANFVDGKEQLGTVGGTPNGTVGPDSFSDIVLTQGDFGVSYNFGELPPASLAGTVYEDLDLSGAREPAEPGIPGTTVTLTGVDDLGGAVSRNTLTDADGNYVFDMLRPGTYTLTETQPAGYFDGDDSQGTLGGTVGNDVVSAVTVGIGAVGTGYDFGEVPPAELSGSVYVDYDNSGDRGSGEPGLPAFVSP